MIVSPGMAGFDSVTRAPPTLAQHRPTLVADRITCAASAPAESLASARMGMPLPAGPSTRARSRTRVKTPALKATASGSPGVLIAFTMPLRISASASPGLTMYSYIRSLMKIRALSPSLAVPSTETVACAKLEP